MAGLGEALAIVSLTGQLFSGVVQSYAFISKAQGLARDAPVAFWKLRIQEIRLRSLGHYWGIERASFEDFLRQEGLIEDVQGILAQMKTLLEDTGKLKERYGLRKETILDPGISGPQKLIENTSLGSTGSPKWSRKFRWAMTDAGKFDRLLLDLKELNDGLYFLLRASEQLSIGRGIESDLLREATLDSECTNLQIACVENQNEPRVSARISQLPYQDLYRAAGSKQIAIEQAQQLIPPPGTSVPSTLSRMHQKDASKVKGYPKLTPSRLRVLAEFDDKPVLVEWKDIDENSLYQPLISQRIENLAQVLAPEALKPIDFRVLDCLGYFKDAALSRYGYIFDLPSGTILQPPLTLYDVMERGGQHENLFNLGDRFAIARSVASSVLRLHDCGWIHTAFRSDSVLFRFRGDEDAHPVLDTDKPFIMGFGYSKPSDPAESTIEFSRPNRMHDLYRHPDIISGRANPFMAHQVRQQQRHDLYSLGIILLEIGLWEQIKSLWKDKYTHQEFLEKLLRVYVPKLGHKMGAIYRDVVHDLLVVHEEVRLNVLEVKFKMLSDRDPSDVDSILNVANHPVRELDWWDIVGRLEKCAA